MSFYTSHNSGYKYFVLFIHIFSRYVWTVRLKTKTGQEVVKALKSVFAQGRKCRQLRTDKGTEFLNRHVEKYLKEVDVNISKLKTSPKVVTPSGPQGR